MKCGHKWDAPYLLAPGTNHVVIGGGATLNVAEVPVRGDTIYMQQVCVLLSGHEGSHRSDGNVTRTQT